MSAKKFNGKLYYEDSAHYSKRTAREVADKIRKRGNLARIMRIKRKGFKDSYIVYYRAR